MNLSTEERIDGLTEVEREVTYYACLKSLECLKDASHVEHHTQWQIRLPKADPTDPAARMRVRKTTDTQTNEVSYAMTLKVKGAGGELETPTPISEDYYDQFQLVSQEGMRKTRYTFDIPGRNEKWEIDVFYLPDGGRANWVKIDFEFVDDSREVPELPDYFSEVIPGNARSKEDQDFIRTLYSDLFIINRKK